MSDSLPDSGLNSGVASKSSFEKIDEPVRNQQDVEALGEKANEQVRRVNPREGIPTWRWVLSMVGLYLAALLYGQFPDIGME